LALPRRRLKVKAYTRYKTLRDEDLDELSYEQIVIGRPVNFRRVHSVALAAHSEAGMIPISRL